MKFLYGLSGANVPVVREFDIEKTEVFYKGKVVRNSSENVISHNVTGNCIGVAMENHTGEKDILNARNDGTKLRVDVTVGGVYEIPAPRLTATDGSATQIVCSSNYLVEGITASKIVLISKGENSENTDSAGTVRKISACTISDGVATITLERGGKVCAGDVYAFLPSHCFKGYLADDAESFTCVSGSGINLTVVGCDEKRAVIEAFLGSRQFNR